MSVYMARCPEDSCVGFNPAGDVWFKIAQYGLEEGLTASNCEYSKLAGLLNSDAKLIFLKLPREM